MDLSDLDIEGVLENLDLGSSRGKTSVGISVGAPRGLTGDEITQGAALRASGAQMPTSSSPTLQRLRSRHHLIAQLLAGGMKPAQVARTTGYSFSRISILQADPTFKELLAAYEGQSENLAFDVKERLRQLSLDTIDVLQQRVDENPDQFEADELFKLAELALDRTGLGKSQITEQRIGIDPELADFLRQNRATPMIANLLEGEILDESTSGGAATDANGVPVEPYQLDLAFEAQDQGPGGAQAGQVSSTSTELHPERSAQLGVSTIGDEVSDGLDEVSEASNLVPFPRAASGSSTPAGSVDRVP